MGDKEHKFWNTQPVPKPNTSVEEEGPIEQTNATKEDPYQLPDDFEWSQIDIDDPAQLTELYQLLSKNYVEHSTSQFRFDYQPEFLIWALKSPNWNPTLLVGIRVKASKKLIGFISAIPASFKTAQSNQVKASEVNFLCVHKKLRSKRMAPMLIREITRRSHLLGVRQGVFTAGIVLPEPFAIARYFHRPLNPLKVLACNFCDDLSERDIAHLIPKFSVDPFELKQPFKYRKTLPQDIPEMFEIFNSYFRQFAFTPFFSLEEFEYWMLPREGVLYSYVFVGESDEIVAFYSFYSLPTSVLDGEVVRETMQVAYSYYYALKSPQPNGISLLDITKCMICEALAQGFDMMNALDVFQNSQVLTESGFLPGDGRLHYYLFNWMMQPISHEQVGFLLL